MVIIGFMICAFILIAASFVSACSQCFWLSDKSVNYIKI